MCDFGKTHEKFVSHELEVSDLQIFLSVLLTFLMGYYAGKLTESGL